jgi:uncharacterized Fe-S center protein
MSIGKASLRWTYCYIILVFLSLFISSFQSTNQRPINPTDTKGVSAMQDSTAIVYLTTDISSAGIDKVIEPLLANLTGKVAVKVHFGEEGNQHYVKPALYKNLIQKLGGTFIETNVLYGGKRHHTETHIQLAKDHGFGIAPIDIIDAEGTLTIPYKGKHFEEVYTGSHLSKYNSLLVISHFKGHGNAGFGGAIKNVGMGMADIRGKLEQHAGSNPKTKPSSCIKCGKCVALCPVDAITLNPLVIDQTKCIACGKCIGACPTHSMQVPWGKTGVNGFMERLADYANAISKQQPCVYINVIAQVSADCDCFGSARKPFIKDIGILASTDMLAIDLASADLVDQAYGKADAFLYETQVSGRYIFEYGEQIGLGNPKYKLVELN